MRLPDPTIRNALVTPFLLVRIPLLLAGLLLEVAGRAVTTVGEAVPGWTDYRVRKASQ